MIKPMFNTRILISLLLSFKLNVYSQPNQIDSLKQLINSAQQDTTKLNAMYELYTKYNGKQPDSAIAMLKTAKLFAEEKLKKTNTDPAFLNKYGLILHKTGNFYISEAPLKSIEYYLLAIKIREKTNDKIGLNSTLNNMGNVYTIIGRIPDAIEYYKRSLKIAEEIGDKEGISTVFNNMATIYSSMGQKEEALKYYNKSLTLSYTGDDEISSLKGETLNNIANIYKGKKEFSEALKYYQQSLEVFQKDKNVSGEALLLSNIAQLYEDQGYFATAIDYCKKKHTDFRK